MNVLLATKLLDVTLSMCCINKTTKQVAKYTEKLKCHKTKLFAVMDSNCRDVSIKNRFHTNIQQFC